MTIGTLNIEGLDVIKDQILSLQNIELTQRWEIFVSRLEIYNNPETNPHVKMSEQFSDWPQRYAFKKRLGKLKRALAAWSELSDNKTIDQSEREKLENVIKQKITIALKEFELAQLKLIQRFQHISRFNDETFKQEIRHDRIDFQKKLFELDSLSDANSVPAVKNFIKHEKSKLHLSEKVPFMQQVSMGFGLGSRVLHFVGMFAHGLHSLGVALSAIPIISAIATAIPMVISAGRTWLKNKSPAQKTLATGLAVLAVGALISVGLGAAATGGLVAGLITLGVVKNQIMPWWKIRQHLNDKQAVVDEINQREQVIHETPITSLTMSEKQMFIHKLEQKYLLASSEEKQSIKNSMKLITHGKNIDDLKSDVNIVSMLKGNTLEAFISQENKTRLVGLNAELKTLKSKEMDSRIGMYNGLLGIAGAILVCIPTPPTVILGASLLMANSIVGLALHFDVPNKIRNFFRSGKSNQSSPTVVSEEGPRVENQLANSKKMIPHGTTSEVIDHLHISPSVVANNHSQASQVRQVRQEPKPYPEPSNDPVFTEPLLNKDDANNSADQGYKSRK